MVDGPMTSAVDTGEVVLAVAPTSDGATSAVVEAFYVQMTEHVRAGMPVALLRSVRYAYDLPSPVDGVVLELLVPMGGTVETGAPLLRLGPADISAEPPPADLTHKNVHATPVARRMALVHGLDLAMVRGSGAGGLIRAGDLRALLGPKPEALPLLRVTHPWHDHRPALRPSSNGHVRKAEVPRETATFTLDMHAVVGACDRAHGQAPTRPVGLTVGACFIAAALDALIEHHSLNSRWTGHGILVHRRIHLAWETDVDGCRRELRIPDASALSAEGLPRILASHIKLQSCVGREPALRPEPTIAISTQIDREGWWSEPVFTPTCGVILTLGPIGLRPIVVETATGPAIGMSRRALLSVAYDARYLTFAHIGAFAESVRQRVEQWPWIC